MKTHGIFVLLCIVILVLSTLDREAEAFGGFLSGLLSPGDDGDGESVGGSLGGFLNVFKKASTEHPIH